MNKNKKKLNELLELLVKKNISYTLEYSKNLFKLKINSQSFVNNCPLFIYLNVPCVELLETIIKIVEKEKSDAK